MTFTVRVEGSDVSIATTGEDWTISGVGKVHGAVITDIKPNNLVGTDALCAALRGVSVSGLGTVRRIERFCTTEQWIGATLGLAVDP